MKHNLKELKQVTTRICKLAFEVRHTFKNAAVNWADFQCAEAECCFNDDDEISYRVCIEEANPENPEVIKFIATELILHGYKDVEIRLEW